MTATASLCDNDQIRSAVEFLSERFGDRLSCCHNAVILGSGLGQPAEDALIRGGDVCDYSEIPGFAATAVVGHRGRLVIAPDSATVYLQGRAHYYEGYSLRRVTFAARLMSALGIQTLVVTNAAGGINPSYRPGDLMLINGHWTFMHVRLADQLSVNRRLLWNAQLIETAAGLPTSLIVHQGSYAMMSGPCYETPAEVRMLSSLGVDAVGMSTIPESLAVAARGVRVMGVSCITNAACGLADGPLDHSEVSEVAGGIEDRFSAWLSLLIDQLNGEHTL